MAAGPTWLTTFASMVGGRVRWTSTDQLGMTDEPMDAVVLMDNPSNTAALALAVSDTQGDLAMGVFGPSTVRELRDALTAWLEGRDE